MNCMEKLNVVTAFEFSEVTLEKLIFENRPQSSIVGNMINKQGDVRFFIAEMVETLSYLKEYILYITSNAEVNCKKVKPTSGFITPDLFITRTYLIQKSSNLSSIIKCISL